MNALTDCDIDSLKTELQRAGFAPSHAARILRTFYADLGTIDPERLGIGRRIPEWLKTRFEPSTRVRTRVASGDGTVKLLVELKDGGAIESVLMPSFRADRAAACISSQVGCAMGCGFCASTRGGLQRNLSAGEMAEQYLHLRREAAASGRRLTSLVFMGMGEPLHNFENLVAAVKRIADPDIGGLGWRQVTVSTVGIVPAMDRLADADLNIHLALSLHAPDDDTRSQIVPMNRRFPVADVMAAARRFGERTGRIPTIEYCMLAGVNDSDVHADALADLMTGFRAHVNLIAYNPIGVGLSGVAYRTPEPERVREFLTRLRTAGVVTHLRVTRGDDVNAACGQLAGAGAG